MSDIAAISLMRARKKRHSEIAVPSQIGKRFDNFLDAVFKATKESTDCLQNVNNYVIRIKTEMQDLRKCVEKFNINLPEKMKVVVASMVDKNTDIPVDTDSGKLPQKVQEYSPSSDTGKFRSNSTMKRFHKEKLNQLSDLQKLNQQQQELLKLITQTNNLIVEIEEEGYVSIERIIDLKQEVDYWAEYLNKAEEEKERKKNEHNEREEQKRKQKEEMREGKERQEREEQRRKEEEERRKEKERQEKEEQRKKKEEEEKKKEREHQEKEEKRREEEEKRRKEEEEAKKREKERQEKEERIRKEKEKEEKKRERERQEKEEKRREEEEKRKERERQEKEEKRRKEEEEAKKRERERQEKEERIRKEKEEEKRKEKERKEKEEQRRKEEEEKRNEKERQKKEEQKKRENEEAKRREKERQDREEQRRKKKEEENRKEKECKDKEEQKRKEKEEEKRKEKERKEKEEQRRKEQEEEKRKEKERLEKEEQRRKEKEEQKRREREEQIRKEEEEEKRKEKERKEKEEQKRKEKEEEKRKEKERQEREEQRRKEREEEERKEKERQEKEKRERERRNWKNWPTITYERPNDDPDSHHRGISCIVSAIPGTNTVKKDDLTCTVSDKDEYKQKFLKQKECPASSVVTIEAKSMLNLEMPLCIFIPHTKVHGHRELIVKAAVDKGPVKSQKTIADSPKTYLKDTAVVGFSINNFRLLEILVVSGPQIQNFVIGQEGGIIISKGDETTEFSFDSDCFDRNTPCTLQVGDKKHIKKITKDVKDLQNIRLAVQPHTISLDQTNKREIRVTTYPDLNQIVNRPQSSAKTFEKELRNISGDTLLSVAEKLYKDGIIGPTAFNDIKAKTTDDYKAKRLADELCLMDEEEFEALMQSLQCYKHTNIVQMLEKVFKENKENNCASDFLGDVTDKEVKIVSCKDKEEWKVMDANKAGEETDAVYVSLPKGGRVFSLMGLIVPKSTTATEIKRLAEILFVTSEQFTTRLLVKQHSDDKRRLVIRCAIPKLMPSVNAELKQRGFTEGPEESFEFRAHEGEIIYLELVGNISFTSRKKNVQLVFYSNSVSGVEVNLRGVASGNDVWNNKFRAELRYNAGLVDQTPPRHGVFKLRLEQEENEFKPFSKRYQTKKNTK